MTKNEILNILNNSYNVNFSSLELLREGGCVSYCVESSSEKYILKIIPSAFMDTAKQSLNILKYLEEKRFPAPYVILTKNGLPYLNMDEFDCKALWVIFNFIDGKEPGSVK